MVYRSIGYLFSQSGLSIAFSEFHENAGSWKVELKTHKSYPGDDVNSLIQLFIEENNLHYQVALITTHAEAQGKMFRGALIAALTELPVITDLAALDIALGGNGQFYVTTSQKLGLPEENLPELKKSICVAFMGILRWREEYNFLSSVTGASRSSIGGAIWLGQEA